MNSKLIPTAVINPDAPSDSLEAKQPDIDNGTAIHDKSGYFSQDYMAREWDDIWTRSWLLAGVVSDLPNTGDYFLFRIRHESFIISNTPDGVVAFYNVCPHRGSRLLSEERGNRKVFVCPFHSWSFTNGGALRSITDEETFKPEVVSHRPSLKRVRCEVHAGLIFINMDDDAAPVSEEIGLPDGYLENYQIDQMKVVRHVRSEWCSNWKVGVEAFYESYHLHAVHPETRGVMSDLNVQYDLYPKGASRMIVPLGQPSPRFPDQTTVNEGLQFMLREAGVDPESFTGTALDVRSAIQQGKRERSSRL